MAETREKNNIFWYQRSKKKKLIQYINISDDKGITDFILSAMEFMVGIVWRVKKVKCVILTQKIIYTRLDVSWLFIDNASKEWIVMNEKVKW